MLRPHSKTYQDKDAAYTRILFERRKLSVLGLRPLERTGGGQKKGEEYGKRKERNRKKKAEVKRVGLWITLCVPKYISKA